MIFKSTDQSYKKKQRIQTFSNIQRLQSFVSKNREVIASGSRLSYAPLSANSQGTCLSMLNFNKIIRVNYKDNTVEVESGVRLLELYNKLKQEKMYLKIQPGHPEITVGACIATNIHGKNNIKEGNFSKIVLEITLMMHDGSIVKASRKKNLQFFEATIGGFGLTGIIISAKLKTHEIQSEFILQKTESIIDLNELPIHLEKNSITNEYAYAFVNMSSPSNKHWGRSLIYSGNFAEEIENETSPGIKNTRNLFLIKNSSIYLPILNNRYFSLAINDLYYAKENIRMSKIIPLKNALYPIMGKEYFFKAFGGNGFVEVQNLIPFNEFREYILSLRALQKKFDAIISLAGAKFFNSPNEGISFSGSGISLSLDIPLNPVNLRFLDSLDKLNIETNSITNIAKDSRLSRHVFEKEFPSTKIFKEKIIKLDPSLKFQSELSKRLSLK